MAFGRKSYWADYCFWAEELLGGINYWADYWADSWADHLTDWTDGLLDGRTIWAEVWADGSETIVAFWGVCLSVGRRLL